MAVNAGDTEAGLIDSICERVKERLPGAIAVPCAEFTRQYYQWVPREDLEERGPLDLYGAAVAHWNLAQHRAPGEAKVHVYNPVLEQHGWQSHHTVVEIITDDMPFLVDSVTMTLGHGGHELKLVIHPVIWVRRDADGNMIEVLAQGAEAPDAIAESVLHVEVERERNVTLLGYLRDRVQKVLQEVQAAVVDWRAMRSRAIELMKDLEANHGTVDDAEVAETAEFLNWLVVNHFTFLGYRDYDLVERDGTSGLEVIQSSGLGILRAEPERTFTPLAPQAHKLVDGPDILVLTKANSRSTVHRPGYLDYIGIKKYNAGGEVIGEHRFLGLYTTSTYRESVLQIPKIREKCRWVLERAGFPPNSHDAKALT
jgi:glutamate dehydrogenase